MPRPAHFTRRASTAQHAGSLAMRGGEFGARLVLLRRKSGLTQVQLANMLGVTQQAITAWEKQTVAPRIELLPEIAKIFGVSTDELFGIDKPGVKKGPSSNLENVFHKVGGLPRKKQDKVISVINALIE